jgi:Mlc titration factor MtfA (ptsG expression regulator)
MVFRWFRNRRRRKLLAAPAPREWPEWLREDLPFYRRLDEAEQRKLLDLVRVFIAEKHWEGRDGFELTDRIKLSIAGQACLLLLHIEHDYYRRVGSIFVYPDTRAAPQRYGLIQEDMPIAGAASHFGPIMLCWNAVRGGAMNSSDGINVVFHEFAHALDFLDHVSDGTPPLGSRQQMGRWVEVMTEHYDELTRRADSGRPSLLSAYGSTNPAEFFAVATETFFEKPAPLKRRLPDLYDVLREYYHQDPVQWPGM